jgi:hypothetical protein
VARGQQKRASAENTQVTRETAIVGLHLKGAEEWQGTKPSRE